MLKTLIKGLFRGQPAAADSGGRRLSSAHENTIAGLLKRARRNIDAGNFDQAQRDCEQILEIDPAEPDAWLQLGRTLNKKNDHVAARKALNQAVALGPDIAAAYFERGIAHERTHAFSSALKDYERTLALKPNSLSAVVNQGTMHYMLGELDQALVFTERALLIERDHRIANRNRGLILRELGRLEEAEQALRRAVGLRADDPESICNLALVLIDSGRFQEAQGCVAQALALDPDNNEARWNQALVFLLQGNFKRGWPYYESRRFRHDALARPYRFAEWDGTTMREGRLLIYAEQGLGDEILFASCFAEAMQRVRHCIIECEPRLKKLFGRSFPSATVHGSKLNARPAWLDGAAPISAQIAAGRLPGLFRQSSPDFPQHSGYLRADSSRVAHWRASLDALGAGLKVGVAWTGGSGKTLRRLRSVAAADLIPLFNLAGAHFVSLQYVDSSNELSTLRDTHQITVHHWQPAIDDYDETAALVCALDLVISVQTAVVHLAGALGKPAWVLVPSSPEWRYMASGTTMPWYPSVRLFRQRQHEDWQPVISAVAGELAQRLQS